MSLLVSAWLTDSQICDWLKMRWFRDGEVREHRFNIIFTVYVDYGLGKLTYSMSDGVCNFIHH